MEHKGNPLVYLFRMVWRFSEGNRHNIVLYWILFSIGNIATMLIHPFAMRKIMNSVQEEGVTERNLYYIFGLLMLSVVSTIIFWAFHGPARVIERGNAFIAEAKYRAFLLKGIIALPLDWHAEHHTGDTTSKVRKGTDAMYGFSSESYNFIRDAVRLIVSCSIISYFSWKAGIIIFLMLGLGILITMHFDKKINDNYDEFHKYENAVAARIADVINTITTIIVLRVEKIVYGTLYSKLWLAQKIFTKNNKLIEKKWFLVSMINAMIIVIVLGDYFSSQVGKAIVIGNVYLLINYLSEVTEIIFNVAGRYSDVMEQRAKVRNAELLSNDFREEDLKEHVLPKDWEEISIQGLTYSYPNTDRLQLNNVSFNIKKGERIALIGTSGSGKTTLLKVLRDLHKPKALKLQVDGADIRDGFPGIAQDIALVPQHPELLDGTIEANLTLGVDYDKETINRCLELACFKDVVEELPKKLESHINERGVNLSGGQKQRLALARGLLICQGKSVILLDEPTSSVDPENQHNIFQGILEGFDGSTVIVTTHQYDLLYMFDRIILFDRGQIMAEGTFGELSRTNEKFRAMLKKFEKIRELEEEAKELVS